MTTKIDIVNCAYSMGRISGLTVQPTPEDLTIALNRLESMAAEWSSQNICTGYAFEDNPDPNTPHNVPRAYWTAFEACLMVRLLADFGKEPSAALISNSRTAFSRMSSSLSVIKPVAHPSRMPRGSGNRWNQWDRFYNVPIDAPTECATVQMVVGDVDTFYENYSAYLNEGETIIAYTLTSDDALTISSLATLAIGTVQTAVSNAAFTYAIAGTNYSKSAVPAGTAPGTDAIPQSTYGAVAFDIDVSGTITAVGASDNATGYDSTILAIAGLPTVASAKYRMGYVTVIKSDGIFTFGTTNLDAANTSVTYTDTNISGSRIIYTVTATGGTNDFSTLYQVKIVATTSAGRIETRVRNFELTEIDIT